MEERPLDQELELADDVTETSRYQYPVPHQIPDLPFHSYCQLRECPVPTLSFLLVPNQGGLIGLPLFIDLDAF